MFETAITTVQKQPTLIAVSGDLDIINAPCLRARVVDALAAFGSNEIVIDLRDVNFIDSSGIRVLVDAHRRATASGVVLRLSSPQGQVLKIMEITGVTATVPVTATSL